MPGSSHERALEALDKRGRLRRLQSRSGIDFASNDYLGLAESGLLQDAVRRALESGVPVGAGGSRLLRGNHEEHEALESAARELFGSEAALYFISGFAASCALLQTLPARGDLVVYDELIHASAHDGMRLCRAETRPVPHNDAGAIDKIIRDWRADGGVGQVWIAVESLYSMDGDMAPLDAIAEISDRHDAMLLIDEAHATGVFGDKGRGLAAHLEGRENVITLHTCGKALGVMGALVACPQTMKDYLINRARNFIFATAPSPLIAATVRQVLDFIADADDRRELLQGRIKLMSEELLKSGRYKASGTQIQPIILGSDSRAVEAARALQADGFDVRAIRPPTVPEGTARLRLAITLNASEADIVRLAEAVGRIEAESQA